VVLDERTTTVDSAKRRGDGTCGYLTTKGCGPRLPLYAPQLPSDRAKVPERLVRHRELWSQVQRGCGRVEPAAPHFHEDWVPEAGNGSPTKIS